MELKKILEENKSTKLDKLFGTLSNHFIIISVLFTIFWAGRVILDFNIYSIMGLVLFAFISK